MTSQHNLNDNTHAIEKNMGAWCDMSQRQTNLYAQQEGITVHCMQTLPHSVFIIARFDATAQRKQRKRVGLGQRAATEFPSYSNTQKAQTKQAPSPVIQEKKKKGCFNRNSNQKFKTNCVGAPKEPPVLLEHAKHKVQRTVRDIYRYYI